MIALPGLRRDLVDRTVAVSAAILGGAVEIAGGIRNEAGIRVPAIFGAAGKVVNLFSLPDAGGVFHLVDCATAVAGDFAGFAPRPSAERLWRAKQDRCTNLGALGKILSSPRKRTFLLKWFIPGRI